LRYPRFKNRFFGKAKIKDERKDLTILRLQNGFWLVELKGADRRARRVGESGRMFFTFKTRRQKQSQKSSFEQCTKGTNLKVKGFFLFSN
jgi:hypothetical protein